MMRWWWVGGLGSAIVAFLLAPRLGDLTGQTLHVNGGSELPG